MRILQLDVDNITYELVKPESTVYEDSKEKRVSVNDALAILVSVEKGDSADTAKKAMEDVTAFMKRVGRKKLVIYPFAHLSSDLAEPKEALEVLDEMRDKAPNGIEVTKAPFGWNKKLSFSIKGHPLAEQSKSYGESADEKKPHKRSKAPALNTAIVRKSDWSGLPETDHRTIGEQQELYSFQEVSPAMVYWHPHGYTIYKELVKFMREKGDDYGYEEISTPAIANLALWEVSGHLDHYKEDMFMFESAFGNVGLKPMNCPSTILIFKSKKWSYRDLPFRTTTFDKIYRSELSGVASGLFRVKELAQDDGHIFAREDQVEEEITSVLRMVKEVYAAFGMKFMAKLSTMPDNHAGEKAQWDIATEALKRALDANGMKYEVKEKEGAFYGPKIDFDVFDSQGRVWQCATVQLDYQMPSRFGLEYTGEDGKQHMPIMIHRAILGSLERFIGVLVEHYQGKFPAWLAPIQVKVVSISEQTNRYAESVYNELKKSRFRAKMDIGDRTLEYKIREAISERVPYVLVLGKKEEESKKLTVRSRGGAQKHGVELAAFIKELEKEVDERKKIV